MNYYFFRATTADVDYLENQCAENPIGQATCDYQEYENQDIGFPDLQITVANQAEVEKNNSKIDIIWIIEIVLKIILFNSL